MRKALKKLLEENEHFDTKFWIEVNRNIKKRMLSIHQEQKKNYRNLKRLSKYENNEVSTSPQRFGFYVDVLRFWVFGVLGLNSSPCFKFNKN